MILLSTQVWFRVQRLRPQSFSLEVTVHSTAGRKEVTQCGSACSTIPELCIKGLCGGGLILATWTQVSRMSTLSFFRGSSPINLNCASTDTRKGEWDSINLTPASPPHLWSSMTWNIYLSWTQLNKVNMVLWIRMASIGSYTWRLSHHRVKLFERIRTCGLIEEVCHEVGMSSEVSKAHVKPRVCVCAYRTALSYCSSTWLHNAMLPSIMTMD